MEQPDPDAGTPEPDGVEVQRLERLRPVPPRTPPARRLTGLPFGDAARLPVYDPFSARRRRAPEWLVAYTAWLVVSDLVAASAAGLLAFWVALPGRTPSTVLAVALLAAWPVLQALSGSYAERQHGTGSAEFRRVLDAGIVLMATLGVLAVTVPVLASGRLILLTPVAVALTALGRGVARRRLHRARRLGLKSKRVVVLGPVGPALDLICRVRRDPCPGLLVVGACVPAGADASSLVALGVPVLGELQRAVRVLDDVRADAVLVASGAETGGPYLRDLAWRLEGTNVELLVCPGVLEVAPSRLHVRPTLTVPLIRIQEPEFRGLRRLVKAVFDRVIAAVLLLLSAPLTLSIALLIRATDHGPALYRHRRIGKRGQEFDVLKFRSMYVDAPPDIALMGLNEGNEVQFKLRTDPRVTRLGRLLRRYSLDELPQLINVLRGDMSLVGPRPHVMREADRYGPDMHRRLLVKPGITGLWQVSGRSDLDWESAVELDVRYVENWSLTLDLQILWKTVTAVLRSSGAY